MIVYYGNELKKYVDNRLGDNYKERFVFKTLENYLNAENDAKVCCLYGLRRTGKTIMSLQAIQKIDDYDKCLFIRCENKQDKEKNKDNTEINFENDTIGQVREAIDKHLEKNPNCKYVFIDEVTKTERFITASSMLSDHYASLGLKVVLTGTDSLGFRIAKGKELLDRSHFIHTTYVPYKEYQYLLGKDIKDYIRYGGTLTDGVENVFYNQDSEKEYTNSAIVDNISHTLQLWKDGNTPNYLMFKNLIEHNEFGSYVRKILELSNRTFLAETINDSFKSHDIGSLSELLEQHSLADDNQIRALRSDEINDRIRIFLGIKEHHFNQADDKAVDVLIDYLKKLDVLYEVPDSAYLNLEGKPFYYKSGEHNATFITEYIFTQSGMRYCQVEEILDALMTSDVFRSFPRTLQNEIKEKLTTDICGRLLEDIIFYQLFKEFEEINHEKTKREVIKYRNIKEDKEIDILVLDYENKTMCGIEVKYSDKATKGQTVHLTDEDFCKEIEAKAGVPFTSKIVVYNGEYKEAEDNIIYLNASEFLSDTENLINILLSNDNFISNDNLISNDEQMKADADDPDSDGFAGR